MTSLTRVCAAGLAGVLLLAACGSGGEDDAPDPVPDEQHEAPAPVAMLTELDPADAGVVAESVNDFGFDLLGELAVEGGNTVTSPVSAATLLAMVLAGAGGETAEAMAQALHLEDPRDARVGALLEQLAATDDVTLTTANSLWADPDIPFAEDYLGFVRDTFAATVDNADLADPATAEAIDGWVADQTEGRIDQMAEDLGLPNPDVALVLLNAVYFLGTWSTEFDPADTVSQPFSLADGGQVEVPMMHLREQEFGYTDQDGYQMVRLPYGDDGRYGMEVLLPDPDSGLPELLAELDAAQWRQAVDGLQEQTVDELALPSFELEWDATLNDALEALGMGPALDPNVADFTPMSSADLYLEQVVQKTFLAVDEEGTEAAAATGGAMGLTSAPMGLQFRVDRPFAFTISDTETGAVLFLGAVTDPTNDS